MFQIAFRTNAKLTFPFGRLRDTHSKLKLALYPTLIHQSIPPSANLSIPTLVPSGSLPCGGLFDPSLSSTLPLRQGIYGPPMAVEGGYKFQVKVFDY